MPLASRRSTRIVSRGSVVWRIALALAMSAILRCATVECVFAADADRAGGAASEEVAASQHEAKRLFLERYAEASARLKAGLTRLHARGRVTYFNAARNKPPDLTTLEFFAKDGKRRVNIDHAGPPERSADKSPEPPEAMLWTSEGAAEVVDPGTDLALATSLSVKPSPAFERLFRAKGWRFVDASYSSLDCLASARCVLESVERDPDNAGWYHTRIRLGPGGQQPMDIWLDETGGFVIRKVSFTPPSGAEQVTVIGPYVSVGEGGWMPEKYEYTAYAPQAPQSGSVGEPRGVLQRIKFELLGGVDTSDIPDSYFTLESLGVSLPDRSRKLPLLLALGAVLLIAAVLSRRKRRIGPAVSPDPSSAPRQLGGS